MMPEGLINDSDSVVSNKKGSEEAMNESKNRDTELDEIPSELLNTINNFFEIHNNFLYEDVLENASSLKQYVSADLTAESEMTGNCSNEKEKVEEEKYYFANSQKLYSSMKRYYQKNVKGKSDLSSENKNLNSLSENKTLINQQIEIERNSTIPDSFQLPLYNETRNTVTFDTFVSENSMIDIKFPLCNLFGLSQDLTEAQRSVRLNKKSTFKYKKLRNNKKVSSKTKECFSPIEIHSSNHIEKPELESMKKSNIKKSTNKKMLTQSKIDESLNSEEIASSDHIGKTKFQSRKTTLRKKNIKKSTNENTIIPSEIKKCFNPEEMVSRNTTEIPKLKNNKITLRKNKKSANRKIITSKTEEYFNCNEVASKDAAEKHEIKTTKFEINPEVDVCYTVADKNQLKELCVLIPDFKINSQDSIKQLKNENDILCFQKAMLKLSTKSDLKASIEKKRDTSKEVLNKSKSGKHSKKNKTSLSADKSNSNKTNNSKKTKNKNFIPDVSNAFMNQSKLAKISTNMVEKKLLKKNKSKIDDYLNEKSLKRKVSRKKSTSLTHSKFKGNIHKINLLMETATQEDKNIFSENYIVEGRDLPVNDAENDLMETDVVTVDKNPNQKEHSETAQPILTSTPLSQNSFVKNTNSSLISGTAQTNSNMLIQLLNKISKSEKILKTDDSIARLFQKQDNSKLKSTNKICKELDLKQDRGEHIQLSSFKGKSNDLSDLKSFRSDEEKRAISISLGKKWTNENNVEILPNKKKCKNYSIKKNSDNNSKDEISKKKVVEDCDSKRTKTTKKQSPKGATVHKPSSRASKRIKKLENKYNGLTSPMKAACTDFPNQKRKSLKKTIQNINSPESYPIHQSVNVMELNSKSNVKRKRSTRGKSVDSLDPNRISKKADSLIAAEPESSYSDEEFDACNFIKVTDVKSLALSEENNENWEEEESSVPASFSEDPKPKRKSRKEPFNSGQKNRRKNKHLLSSELYSHHSSFNSSGNDNAQPEGNALVVFNPSDKTRSKRKKISTSVDPNFYYENNSQIRREDKSFSNHKKYTELADVKESPRKNKRCEEINSSNGMINAGTVLEKKAQDSTIKNSNDENFMNSNPMINAGILLETNAKGSTIKISNCENFLNSNSNGMPMPFDQMRKQHQSTCVIQDINRQQSLIYDIDQSVKYLAYKLQNLPNMPSIPQLQFQIPNYPLQNFPSVPHFISLPQSVNSMLVPEQNFQSVVNSPRAASVVSGQTTASVFVSNGAPEVFAPQTIPSVVSTNNLSSLISNQYPSYKVQPQTTLSTVNPQTVSVPRSEECSDNLCSGDMRVVLQHTKRNTETTKHSNETKNLVNNKEEIHQIQIKDTTLNAIQNDKACKIENSHNMNNSPRAASVVSGQTTPSVFVSSGASGVFAPQTTPSVVSTNHLSSLFSKQNPLYKVQLQTILSTINPQTISVPRSENDPYVTVVYEIDKSVNKEKKLKNKEKKLKSKEKRPQIQNEGTTLNITKKAIQNDKACKIENTHNMNETAGTIFKRWGFYIQHHLIIDAASVSKTTERLFGKKCEDFKVTEFCSIPEVAEEISKLLVCSNIKVQFGGTGSCNYEFQDKLFDEACIYVLKDFVQFHMESIFEEIQGKYGNELAIIFHRLMYEQFPFPVIWFFGLILSDSLKENLTVEKIVSALSFIGIIYIFYNFQKRFKNAVSSKIC